MTIHAAYNFVPLANRVCKIDHADKISHDIPFQDGINATFDIILTAHTPLMAGGRRGSVNGGGSFVEFFKTPDGMVAIPGSTIRGMIRAVIEIAAFGKMKFVDDRRYGLRDLTGALKDIYGSKMTKTTAGGAFETRTKAGWLNFSNGQWEIEPCDVGRIEQRDLQILSGSKVNFGKRQSAEDKYANWAKHRQPLVMKFKSVGTGPWVHSCGDLAYQKLEIDTAGSIHGTLVFTGQPSDRKHMEFVFHTPSAPTFVVPDAAMRGFLDLHEDAEKPSPAWTYWKSRLASGHRIPVFYLGSAPNVVTSLGLAQMYKRAYDHTIQHLVKNASPDHLSDDVWDMAEAIFGRVTSGSDRDDALRGRASFGTMKFKEGGMVDTRATTTVLAAPKPSYVPNYVCQLNIQPGCDGTQLENRKPYTTYDNADAQIRGWKRYPVRPNMELVQAPRSKSSVDLKPLRGNGQAKPVFTGKLRVHNVRPFELGALVWAVTWGNDEDLRHSLGMAKSMGLGQVSLKFDCDLNQALKLNDGSSKTLDQCMQIFVEHMNNWFRVGDWAQSPQIKALAAMANPALAGSQNGRTGEQRPLKAMTLEMRGANGFQDALSKGRVLAEYWTDTDVVRMGRQPTGNWIPPESAQPRQQRGDAPGAGPAAPPNTSIILKKGEKVTDPGGTTKVAQNYSRADLRAKRKVVTDDGEEISLEALLNLNPHLRERLDD